MVLSNKRKENLEKKQEILDILHTNQYFFRSEPPQRDKVLIRVTLEAYGTNELVNMLA